MVVDARVTSGDEHAAIRAEARAWLAEHRRDDLTEDEWLAMVVDAGWSAPSWPVGSFGRGVSPEAARAVDDEFKAAGATGYGQDVSNLWANTVLAFGRDELKQRVLRGLLLHTIPMCLLYSEPGAG